MTTPIFFPAGQPVPDLPRLWEAPADGGLLVVFDTPDGLVAKTRDQSAAAKKAWETRGRSGDTPRFSADLAAADAHAAAGAWQAQWGSAGARFAAAEHGGVDDALGALRSMEQERVALRGAQHEVRERIMGAGSTPQQDRQLRETLRYLYDRDFAIDADSRLLGRAVATAMDYPAATVADLIDRASGLGNNTSVGYLNDPLLEEAAAASGARRVADAVAGIPSEHRAAVTAAVHDTLGRMVAETAAAPTVIRMDADSAVRVLRDGKARTIAEMSDVQRYIDTRAEVERSRLGVPDDAAARPVYGFLDGARDGGASLPTVRAYGTVAVTLKPSTAARTTVSWGDSLQSPVYPLRKTDAVNASPERRAAAFSDDAINVAVTEAYGAIAAREAGTSQPVLQPRRPMVGNVIPYVEAQVHGGVTAADVASIERPRRSLRSGSDPGDVFDDLAWEEAQSLVPSGGIIIR